MSDRDDAGVERSEFSMECYDCERRFSRSAIEMHEVPVEHKDKSGYRFVPVPICHECALRRFGIKCDHCGEFHEDVEAVFECKRDRPGLIPDGGVEMTWDHEQCPRDGCEGELQHVSDYDVMCLECEEVFTHVTKESKHYLVDQDWMTAAEKEKLVTDGGRCVECGEDWEENPARKVECPSCGAAVGSPCKRPSGWDCSPHAERYEAAVPVVCPLDECEAVDGGPEELKQQKLVTDGGFEQVYGPHCTWFDVEWTRCIRCRGDGERVECYDDLCHAQGRCMHDPANNVCNLCGGTGVITTELEERWLERDSFEAVTAPAADLWNQGKIHAVARAERQEVTADV